MSIWYTVIVDKGRANGIGTTDRTKIFQKTFEKPIDKSQKIWYNVYVIKRGQTLKKQKGNNTMAMTEREFLNSVLAIEGISKELSDYATEGIAKLDARNDKRKNTQTKTQKENEGVMTAIVDHLTANGADVASAIATAVGVSTQKASALCGLLVKDGTLTVTDIKVKGKGTVKQYAVAEVETAEETSAEDGE